MATAHNGVVFSHEPGFLFDNIRIVPAGLPFNSADMINPGLRDAGKLQISSITKDDVNARPKVLYMDNQLTFISEQVKNLLFMNNWMELSRVLNDVQMRLVGGGSESVGWFTYKTNQADLDVNATGSTSLANKWKFTLSKDTAQVEVTMNGYMTSQNPDILTEADWLFTNSDTAVAGNSDGSTLGLEPQGYEDTGLAVPIIQSVSITNSAGQALFGKCGLDSVITYETEGGAPDTRNRQLAQAIMADWDLVSVDLNKTQILAFLTDSREDISITVADLNGNFYTLTGARLAPMIDISEVPGSSACKIKVKGRAPMNPASDPIAYIDLAVSNANEWVMTLDAGYNP